MLLSSTHAWSEREGKTMSRRADLPKLDVPLAVRVVQAVVVLAMGAVLVMGALHANSSTQQPYTTNGEAVP